MFLGVDLAWGQTAKTGLAAVSEDGELLSVTDAVTDEDITSHLKDWGDGPVLVAFDAPIIVNNDIGNRPCERLVGRYFGRYRAFCHSSNRANPAFATGTRAQRLASALDLDVDPASTAPRRAIEVYPHPAIVAVFDLPAILRYKSKPGRDLTLLKSETKRLVSLIEGLSTAEVAMSVTGCADWEKIRTAVEAARRKADLDKVEDRIDAVICAYVAMYSVRSPDQTTVLGDVSTGYIVTPTNSDVREAIKIDRQLVGDTSGRRTRSVRQPAKEGPVRATDDEVIQRFSSLRQHQSDGRRSPHKPLLVLAALGRLTEEGRSNTPFSVMEERLSALLSSFGPPSRKTGASAAAYPFTRLRSDGVWSLSQNVPMDLVNPLREHNVSGSFTPDIEARLRASPELVTRLARVMVESQFPDTMASDVLTAVGLDPDAVLHSPEGIGDAAVRRRSASWVISVLDAWDRQCAFCGFDGQLGGSSVAIEAAHVRWFKLGGPDELDNGLALCSLHHKLFDRGALGLSLDYRVKVSDRFTSRTTLGRTVYQLDGAALIPRPGTPLPASQHVSWHDLEVFQGQALKAH